jgi:hypothetical protein
VVTAPRTLHIAPGLDLYGTDFGSYDAAQMAAELQSVVEASGWAVTLDPSVPHDARLQGVLHPEEGDHLGLDIDGRHISVPAGPGSGGDSVFGDDGLAILGECLAKFAGSEPPLVVAVRYGDAVADWLWRHPDLRLLAVPLFGGGLSTYQGQWTVDVLLRDAVDAGPIPRGDVRARLGEIPVLLRRGIQYEHLEAERDRYVVLDPDRRNAIDILLEDIAAWNAGPTEPTAPSVAPGTEVTEHLVVPELVRLTVATGPDRDELVLLGEELLAQARAYLAAESQDLTTEERLLLRIACSSLEPQLASPKPNLDAYSPLFVEIVGWLAKTQDHQPFAAAVLEEATGLGVPDPVEAGGHAEAIVQQVLDEATGGPGLLEEAKASMKRGAEAGRAGAMADVERRVEAFVAGLPRLVVNGAWISASAVAAEVVHVVAADARLAAGTGLVSVILRFVLTAYRRRGDG